MSINGLSLLNVRGFLLGKEHYFFIIYLPIKMIVLTLWLVIV